MTPQTLVLGVRHVSLAVRDVKRAMRFYGEFFDFVPYYEGQDWGMVSCGDTTLSFIENRNLTDASPVTGAKHESHFGVVAVSREAVDRLRVRLASAGHSAGKAVEHRDGAYGFYFRDPDGNIGECIDIPHRSKTEALSHEGRILIAQGSEDSRWAEWIESISRRVSVHLGGAPCAGAYLSDRSPTVAEVARLMVGAHADLQKIFLVPVVFSGVGAAKNELDTAVSSLRERFPEIEWIVTPPIGESTLVQSAIISKISWLGKQDHL